MTGDEWLDPLTEGEPAWSGDDELLDDLLWDDVDDPPPSAEQVPGPGPDDQVGPAGEGLAEGEPATGEPAISLEVEPDDPALDAGPELWPELDLALLEAAAAVDPAVLSTVFGVATSDVVDVAARLGLDEALDAHTSAVLLGELGVDASVEHGDVDALAEAVQAGEQVLVPTPDGRLVVTAVDREGGRVLLQDPVDGSVHAVDLGLFEQAWEGAAYALVRAPEATAPGEVALPVGPVSVLGLTLGPDLDGGLPGGAAAPAA